MVDNAIHRSMPNVAKKGGLDTDQMSDCRQTNIIMESGPFPIGKCAKWGANIWPAIQRRLERAMSCVLIKLFFFFF